jgi:hypothetical protein
VIPELRSYLDELRGTLEMDPAAADEVVRELETHAEDWLEDLRLRGEGEEGLAKVLQRHFGRPRVLARLLREAHTRATWQEASLAAAPFLLTGALFATHLWHNPLVLCALAAFVVSVTLGAYWHGKPSWFYTWAGTALTIVALFGYLAFLTLRAHAPALVDGTKNPFILQGVAGSALYYPLAVLVLLWCTTVVVRRDWVLASVMLSPLLPVTMWLVAVHRAGGLLAPTWSQVTGYDNLLAGTFLGMALAVTAIIRTPSRTLKVATLVGSPLLILAVQSGARGPGSLLAAVAGPGILILGLLLIPAAIDGLMSAGSGQIIGRGSRPGGSS